MKFYATINNVLGGCFVNNTNGNCNKIEREHVKNKRWRTPITITIRKDELTKHISAAAWSGGKTVCVQAVMR